VEKREGVLKRIRTIVRVPMMGPGVGGWWGEGRYMIAAGVRTVIAKV